MSAETAEPPQTLRNYLPGPCAIPESDGGHAELFLANDIGATSTTESLQRAIGVCMVSCRPETREICKANSSEIAEFLWDLGASAPVLGAQQFEQRPQATAPSPRAKHLERPAFAFPHSSEPPYTTKNAAHKLALLRQAIRSGTVHRVSAYPLEAKAAGEVLLKKFDDDAPEAYVRLVAALGQETLADALKRIASYIYWHQNAGAAGTFARKKHAPIDVEGSYEMVKLYMNEAEAIHRLGIKDPTLRAASHDPDFFKDIIASNKDRLSFSEINRAIAVDALHPEREIIRRITARQAVRAARLGSKTTSLANIAEASNPVATAAAKADVSKSLKEKYGDAGLDNASATYYANHTANPEKAVQDYLGRVADCIDHFRKNPNQYVEVSDIRYFARNHPLATINAMGSYIEACTALDGLPDEHGLLTAKKICELARAHPNEKNAIKRAQTVIANYEALLTETDHSITDKSLRKCAFRGMSSFLEAKKYDAGARITTSLANPKIKLDGWICRHIANLHIEAGDGYPETFAAAKDIVDFMNEGLLVLALSETSLLRSNDIRAEISTICHPKTGQYIGLAGELQALKPEERVALASCLGLRILYGRIYAEEDLQTALGVQDVRQFVNNDLVPRCRELLAQNSTSEPAPLSLTQLNDDLVQFEQLIAAKTETGNARPEDVAPQPHPDIVTIVGGDVLQISFNDPTIFEDVSQAERNWLQRVVSENFTPHKQAIAAAQIHDALTEGLIMLEPMQEGGYRFVFSLLVRRATELQQAAIAQKYSLAPMMYGQNLEPIIKARSQKSAEQIVAEFLGREPIVEPDITDTDTQPVTEIAEAPAIEKPEIQEATVLEPEVDMAEAQAPVTLTTEPPADNKPQVAAEKAKPEAPDLDAESTAWLQAIVGLTHNEPSAQTAVLEALQRDLANGMLVMARTPQGKLSVHFAKHILNSHDAQARKTIAQGNGYYDVLYDGQFADAATIHAHLQNEAAAAPKIDFIAAPLAETVQNPAAVLELAANEQDTEQAEAPPVPTDAQQKSPTIVFFRGAEQLSSLASPKPQTPAAAQAQAERQPIAPIQIALTHAAQAPVAPASNTNAPAQAEPKVIVPRSANTHETNFRLLGDMLNETSLQALRTDLRILAHTAGIETQDIKPTLEELLYHFGLEEPRLPKVTPNSHAFYNTLEKIKDEYAVYLASNSWVRSRKSPQEMHNSFNDLIGNGVFGKPLAWWEISRTLSASDSEQKITLTNLIARELVEFAAWHHKQAYARSIDPATGKPRWTSQKAWPTAVACVEDPEIFDYTKQSYYDIYRGPRLTRREAVEIAKDLCRGCGALAVCAEQALQLDFKDMIGGGMDPAEQRKVRELRGIAKEDLQRVFVPGLCPTPKNQNKDTESE